VFTPEIAAAPTTLEEQEKEHILRALDLAKGNRSEAARMLGIDRVSLWRKLKKFGL
jgi:transcriptional regulator of acetoin/glycerol metabolism